MFAYIDKQLYSLLIVIAKTLHHYGFTTAIVVTIGSSYNIVTSRYGGFAIGRHNQNRKAQADSGVRVFRSADFILLPNEASDRLNIFRRCGVKDL